MRQVKQVCQGKFSSAMVTMSIIIESFQGPPFSEALKAIRGLDFSILVLSLA